MQCRQASFLVSEGFGLPQECNNQLAFFTLLNDQVFVNN
jgi:hypothetical protein